MNITEAFFDSPHFVNRVECAYRKLIYNKSDAGLNVLERYMNAVGFDVKRFNYQLTFIPKSSRSPTCERIVVNMSGYDAGDNAEILAWHADAYMHSPTWNGWYISQANVRELDRRGFQYVDTTSEAASNRTEQEDTLLREFFECTY